MISERDANKAREIHSDDLRKSGAHAIGVDKVKGDFCVVAYYEERPTGNLPDSLEVESYGKKKRVPLRTEITPMAELE